MKGLDELKNIMKVRGINACIVPTSDYHGSEYVSEYFCAREYLSGFTGSAGTLVVVEEEVYLFTDGRYYVQAEKELEGSGIVLMRSGSEGVPTVLEFLKERAQGIVACDGRVINADFGRKLERICQEKGFELQCQEDLPGMVWHNRPAMPCGKVYELGMEYAGESRKDKLARVRSAMTANDYHVVSSLDDIAWLLNLRGCDVKNNPVFLAYLIMDGDKVWLYANKDKISGEIAMSLECDGVVIKNYDDFYNDLSKLKGSVLLDESKVNYRIVKLLEDCRLVNKKNPEYLMKAVKNFVETENLKKAHIKDGVSFVKFQVELTKRLKSGEKLSEYDVVEMLAAKRRSQEDYLDESFDTISAWNANASMMHYSAKKNDCAQIEGSGMLLIDSGSQYYNGTTDSTRTLVIGEVQREWAIHYTTVLRGMIRLAKAKFLKGATGINLDILARGPVWEMMLDYRCSTGHGVGYLNNVHEGPNAIRWKSTGGEVALEPGMVTTDEPGLYVDGSHGIRIENELLCVECGKNEYGTFYGFETLTLIPVDTGCVLVELMEQDEVRWLNEYHCMVYEKLVNYLNEEEAEWLKDVTKPLKK